MELDRIAVRILEQDLLAAGPLLDLVPEPRACGPECFHRGDEVVDVEHNPVPSAGFLAPTILRGGVPYGSAQRTRDGEMQAMLLPARPHTSDVLPVGEYEVVVDLGARGEYRAAVTVAPSETAEVRIRVP